jgi:hypothetical protein
VYSFESRSLNTRHGSGVVHFTMLAPNHDFLPTMNISDLKMHLYIWIHQILPLMIGPHTLSKLPTKIKVWHVHWYFGFATPFISWVYITLQSFCTLVYSPCMSIIPSSILHLKFHCFPLMFIMGLHVASKSQYSLPKICYSQVLLTFWVFPSSNICTKVKLLEIHINNPKFIMNVHG